MSMPAGNISSMGPSGPNGIPAALWNLPAIRPPAGIKSNFDHPETRAREIIIINAVFLGLMLLTVVMRFCVRRSGNTAFSWDGLMCVIAVLGSITHSILMITSLEVGYGRHMWDIRAVTLTRPNLLRMNQMSMAYCIAVCFAKLSVLLLYRRFFRVIRLTNMLIWSGIGFNILITLVFMGFVIAQALECLGLEGLSKSFCTDVDKVTTSQAAINVFLDFYILFVPLQQVFQLKVSTKRKLGVAAIFSLGFLACIVSVVRLGWTIKNLHESDSFWATVLNSQMSIAEINILIIAPCLVFAPAFIRTSQENLSSLRSRLLTSRGRSRGSLKQISSEENVPEMPQHSRTEVHKQQSVELVYLAGTGAPGEDSISRHA
ncbi:hypothetical protein BKA63DRAFT_513979 [Paraphoma chrysanthemicola]|nr:hypothetical protein BKA63DRAFT_513979 [Paraphoma chrysanthemicola]